jgi:hypothetical protein
LADIVGGGATSGLAKGESGGHPIIGMVHFKRGFPEARVRCCESRLASARSALMGGPLSFYGPFR